MIVPPRPATYPLAIPDAALGTCELKENVCSGVGVGGVDPFAVLIRNDPSAPFVPILPS